MRTLKLISLSLLVAVIFVAFPFDHCYSGNFQIAPLADASGTITTVAGNGQAGSTGDGGPAINASLQAAAVTVDTAGNLSILDTTDAIASLIRRIDNNGNTIKTIAGNGIIGFSGDGGPATAASFNQVVAIKADFAGNLFIADGINFRVRKIDASTNIITTVAGNGETAFNGDGRLATRTALIPSDMVTNSQGDLFITDIVNDRILRVNVETGIITTFAGTGKRGFSGDGGPATQAMIDQPIAIALDAGGNIFFVDQVNKRIRRIDINTGIITTVAGRGQTGGGTTSDGALALDTSVGFTPSIAIDRAGNIFFAQLDLNIVRKIDAATGIVSTVAGNRGAGFSGDGGPADRASLKDPSGIAIDSSGNLFIADLANLVVRKVSTIAKTTAPEVVINAARFNKNQKFMIGGMGFTVFGATVTINGKDVTSAIASQIDNRILFNGTADALNLKKGKNRVTVKANNMLSNIFKFTLK